MNTRRRNRAHAAVLWGFVLFAVVQCVIGLSSERYPRIRDPLYGDKLVKLQRRFPTGEPRPLTVLMLGSSRTGLAFHGKRIEQQLIAELGRPVVAFNYGTPASGPVTHLVYLKRLLKGDIQPDLLFVEVLPSMIADGHGGPIERHWLYADRLTYSERDIVIRNGFDKSAVQERWWKSMLIPAYTLRFQLLSRIAPSWLPWQVRFDWSRGADESGWGTTASQNITPELLATGTARAKAEYVPMLANYHPGGPACEALRELLTLCRERNIPVRMVLMPEGGDFRSWFPQPGLERLMTFLNTTSAEFNAPLVNAREWLPDEHFYDSHHMFAAGAEAFSDRLTRDAIVPMIRITADRK